MFKILYSIDIEYKRKMVTNFMVKMLKKIKYDK